MTAAGPPGDSVALDASGIIHIRILGMWTNADVDRFFAALAPLHHQARDRFGRVCVLIEVEAVHSPLVVLYVRKQALAIKRPGDRTAVVVATVLSRLQIRRLGGGESVAVFSDRQAARDWLLR